MKYLSLDIETSGLRPDKDQVLQLAMVVDDLEDPKPLSELPRLNAFIHHEEVIGQAFALQMNDWILRIIAEKDKLPEGSIMTNMTQLNGGVYFDENGNIAGSRNPVINFLREHFSELETKVTVAGKNAAGFDIPFLPKAITPCFHPQVLDVGSMYTLKSDKIVPDLDTCLKRAGVSAGKVTHDALDDALKVVKIIRAYYDIKV